MSREQILKAALDWAKRGVPVFPCGLDKAPLTANGHKDATTNPEQVKFLFENVGDCLIGARMGAESGLFALDFDSYKPGAAGQAAQDYMQYLSDKGLLDDTQIHTTRSGGLHLLYRGDGAYPNVKPSLGVEVKGEGGYIIVPPSDGYQIQKRGIAYANPKLVQELLRAKKDSSASSVSDLKLKVLSGEAFHDPLTQIAARRAAQGWSVERVLGELLDCLQSSAAREAAHSGHSRWRRVMANDAAELLRIVGSGNEKFNPNEQFDKAKDNVNSEILGGLLGAGEGLFGKSSAADGDSDSAGDEAVPDWGTEAWPFEGVGYSSLTDRPIFDQSFVAYPLFAERESVLIAAEPKVGKTAIALKLAMQVAYGEDLGADFKVAEQRPVLYFTLEGARAVEMRIRAELEDRRARELDPPERDMLFVVDRPHNFGDEVQRTANGAKIVLHNEMCKREFGTELGLIVIDTLTKAMPGKDQNSVEDTSALFEIIGFLRSNGVNATIVFIHHLSKQGNVRGSTNIEAEVDVVLGVSKDKKSGLIWMDVRRARSMDEEISYAFRFESHYLGETKQGHKLHAPVVRLVEADVDTTGATAAGAVRYAKNMDAIVALGKGTHDVGTVVLALAEVTDITPPTGKRPNFRTRAITDALNNIFNGQKNWSYGNYILRVEKDGDIITALTILAAS